MTALVNQKPLWSRAEKDFVEQLYFEKWSPSGIAAQVHEKFGTDRTRQQVSDLIRVSSNINQTVTMDPSARRFISRRKPVERFALPKPMREVVAKVNTVLISGDTEQRIIELWKGGASYDSIASDLDLRIGAVVAFVGRNPDRCKARGTDPATPKRHIDLETCQCRFPVGRDGGETQFCAQWIEPGIWQVPSLTSSYCSAHRKIAATSRRN